MNFTDETTGVLADRELSKAAGGITPEEMLAENGRTLPEATRPGFDPAMQKWKMDIETAEKNAEAARLETFLPFSRHI